MRSFFVCLFGFLFSLLFVSCGSPEGESADYIGVRCDRVCDISGNCVESCVGVRAR